jgi:hypothetical protein
MSLLEGKDYYIENGKYVFTSHYLMKRGYCCACNCRHCPYAKDNPQSAVNNTTEIEKEELNSIFSTEDSFLKEKKLTKK